ncbi:LptF/LptG family permease [Limibacter armeniacum]|uniref:LptF/LptG family permease n=1 Tax=Limibacter armeniacum TaxID=466084 RepID=UPI002FE661DA
MFKKLDKLLLKAFSGPFILTFFIVLFIFHSQFMISKFKYLVGKGLGLDVYGELFFYFALSLVPVSLPLAVLLASLMTFGNLGQHSEITAIKASGINMLRVLRPVAIVTVFVMLAALVYNDTVVPWSNLKGYSLLYDAKQKKPTLELTEGAFYNGLDGYSIKVDKKLEDGKSIEGVIIYKHNNVRGNKEVILAKSGTMETVMDETYLLMRLFEGRAYSEQEDKKKQSDIQYVTNMFDTAQFFFSMESYGLGETKEDLFKGHNLMKTRTQMLTEKDSVTKAFGNYNEMLVKNFESQFYYQNSLRTGNYDEQKKDSADVELVGGRFNPEKPTTNMRIVSSAYNSAVSFSNVINSNVTRMMNQQRQLAKYEVDINKKVTSAVAILVMFLIGAPLGAIIKKGGLGVPVIISVIFFVVYYITTITGEKMAKELVLTPVVGSWISNLLLFVIGVLFLIQAKNDVRLFDADYYAVFFKKLFKKSDEN